MQIRSERKIEDLRQSVEQLRIDAMNLAALSAGPDRTPLRNSYLNWVSRAEDMARLVLTDVDANQFATNRWNAVISGSIPDVRLWSVVDADTKAHLDWFDTTITSLEVMPAAPRIDLDENEPWVPGQLRCFLSHIAEEKGFAGEVATEMAEIGIHGFVAHDSIEPSAEWQRTIEQALRTAHFLVGLVHPGFSMRPWCQQEVGWALGREIPVFMVRLGEDPHGFPAKFQAPSITKGDAWKAATAVASWLSEKPQFQPVIVPNLVSALRNASSFIAAKEAAIRLEEVDRLTPAILDEIESAYLNNNQLYPHHVGAAVIERILDRYGRVLPIS